MLFSTGNFVTYRKCHIQTLLHKNFLCTDFVMYKCLYYKFCYDEIINFFWGTGPGKIIFVRGGGGIQLLDQV
jgi:hypothetical protein